MISRSSKKKPNQKQLERHLGGLRLSTERMAVFLLFTYDFNGLLLLSAPGLGCYM
jgi:hypothetical protein